MTRSRKKGGEDAAGGGILALAARDNLTDLPHAADVLDAHVATLACAAVAHGGLAKVLLERRRSHPVHPTWSHAAAGKNRVVVSP